MGNIDIFDHFELVTECITNIDAYNVKGLKGQIMSFQQSRKPKNIKKLHIFF
jgi:hypothetical protein